MYPLASSSSIVAAVILEKAMRLRRARTNWVFTEAVLQALSNGELELAEALSLEALCPVSRPLGAVLAGR